MNAPLLHLTLSGERPLSANRYYTGLHFGARQAEVARVRATVRAAFDPAQATIITRPVNVVVVAYFAHHDMDASNVFCKPYEDALKSWFIEDDDPAHVAGVLTASRHDKAHPRVEIWLFDASQTIPTF